MNVVNSGGEGLMKYLGLEISYLNILPPNKLVERI